MITIHYREYPLIELIVKTTDLCSKFLIKLLRCIQFSNQTNED